jgi:hypothetical protein
MNGSVQINPVGKWPSRGSQSIIPPPAYWAQLSGEFPNSLLNELKRLSDNRLNEFTSDALPLPESAAVALLDRIAEDGWLKKIERLYCPNCDFQLTDQEAAQTVCPNCNEAYNQHDNVIVKTIYIRQLAPTRVVDWVIAIHGMNTRGEWQEIFSWHLATTWGRSVPVAIYKYGFVIAGVLLAWRRKKLVRQLRSKLAALHAEAFAQGFIGKPDVIAHSFGTWLFGHLLKSELKRQPQERLHFGRIILTGCILRPDFDWKRIRDAGLVENVLNHYGTNDIIVPLAHFTIIDSGPSGRRGFDSDQVLNIRAEDCGHSDLFSTKQFVVNGKSFKPYISTANNLTHLEHSYKCYWRPFLTLPAEEFGRLPNIVNTTVIWQSYIWPLRGTLFPFLIIPLIVTLAILFTIVLGFHLWDALPVFSRIAVVSATGIVLLTATTSFASLFRCFYKRKGKISIIKI